VKFLIRGDEEKLDFSYADSEESSIFSISYLKRRLLLRRSSEDMPIVFRTEGIRNLWCVDPLFQQYGVLDVKK